MTKIILVILLSIYAFSQIGIKLEAQGGVSADANSDVVVNPGVSIALGYSIGFSYRVNFSETLSIKNELLYSVKLAEYVDGGDHFFPTTAILIGEYADFNPILSYRTSFLSLNVGPTFSFNLSGLDIEISSREISLSSDHVAKVIYGIQYGFDIHVYEGFAFNFKLYRDFTNMNVGTSYDLKNKGLKVGMSLEM